MLGEGFLPRRELFGRPSAKGIVESSEGRD